MAQLEYASATWCVFGADIVFAVSKLSRFIRNPNVEHCECWKIVMLN